MCSYLSALTPPKDYDHTQSSSSCNTEISNQAPSKDCPNNSTPWLEILEEPVEKHRFLYKTELASKFGCLVGQNSGTGLQQTYPTVKLRNFDESAVIRCSLFQIYNNEPHAHQLVRKLYSEEIEDPHNIGVGPEIGFTASFNNMGIVYTPKKCMVSVLCRKYTILKQEWIARKEGTTRTLTSVEESEVKQKAEFISNHINLNQVCLKFEAFKNEMGVMVPICSAVCSQPISNLACSLYNDLKIDRIDQFFGSTSGGQEVFLLVEKVCKTNIKVRLFEVDNDDNEVWSAYGKFNNLDVHHQYAIVFKTPPYKTVEIDKSVNVFIELERPSDGAKSAPISFTYTPSEIIQKPKRVRGSYNSNCSCDLYTPPKMMQKHERAQDSDNNSCNFDLDTSEIPRKRKRTQCSYSNNINTDFLKKDLPIILSNIDLRFGSKELVDIEDSNNFDSGELYGILEQLDRTDIWFDELHNDVGSISKDSPLRSPAHNNVPIDDIVIRQLESEITHFFCSFGTYSDYQRQRISVELEHILINKKYKLDENHILHSLILKKGHTFLYTLLRLIQKYKLPSIVNIPNELGQTPLHLAVQTNNENVIQVLLEANADIAIQDIQGNTPLHVAIAKEVPIKTLQLLFNYKNTEQFIDLKNNEGNTALHMAIKNNNLETTRMLCCNGADVNVASSSNTISYTPLHMALADQHEEIVVSLLKYNCIRSIEDLSVTHRSMLLSILGECGTSGTSEIFPGLENLVKEAIKEEKQFVEILDSMSIPIFNPTRKIKMLYIKYQNMTYLPDDCKNEISKLLNTSGALTQLAERLGYGFMLETEFMDDANPAISFLDFLMASRENLFRIREALNSLGEEEAISILDNAVEQES